MNEELTRLILKELGRNRDRRQIVRRVCEQSSLNRAQAEQLIALLEAQRGRLRAGGQAPALLLLSIGALLLGLTLLAFNMQAVSTFFHAGLAGPLLGGARSYQGIREAAIGAGLTAGGVLGLWKAYGVIFPG